jgi:hypothetical protein
MAVPALPRDQRRRRRLLLSLPARVIPPAFVPVAAGLSTANRAALRSWGWTLLDHHGVPWPSSLALLRAGRLQVLSFAASGASLIGLAAALPRGIRSVSLASAGAGLIAAALPLDPPDGDPARLRSWVHSWRAAVHAGGFLLAGPAGIVAVAVSRRRADVALAAALTAAVGVGRTPGWYAFLAGFFGWTWNLARTVARERSRP